MTGHVKDRGRAPATAAREATVADSTSLRTAMIQVGVLVAVAVGIVLAVLAAPPRGDDSGERPLGASSVDRIAQDSHA
ncbi:hypothetical protein [Gordonia humi]|uniref:Uncharacterized protein n=1 Tax=Gordonia humi TaxID=686429 RepID=A0A840EY74_9ACTN|nr:hypothetical protein [Gordonia humi]MBB4133919.1 hypothetical protein [Gordonia humi]